MKKTRSYTKQHQVPTFVYLNRSTIEDAGRGLFARQRLKKGRIIGKYVGRILSVAAAERMPNTDYQILVQDPLSGKQWVVDGLVEGNYTRFINHACYADEQNAAFKYDPRTKSVKIVALRPIDVDEEILVSYGKDYSRQLCLRRYLGELHQGILDYEQFVDICVRTGISRRDCGKMARTFLQ